MRISDWSSDVCSSDLCHAQKWHARLIDEAVEGGAHRLWIRRLGSDRRNQVTTGRVAARMRLQIGANRGAEVVGADGVLESDQNRPTLLIGDGRECGANLGDVRDIAATAACTGQVLGLHTKRP